MIKAFEDACENIQGLLEIMGPLPTGFYDDPFILGFVYCCAVAIAFHEGAEEDDFAEFGGIYDRLFEGDGPSILAATMSLVDAKDPDCDLGAHAAKKFLAASWGHKTFDQDPGVMEAKRRAAETMEMAKDDDLTAEQALFVWLYDIFFMSEVRKRFPGNAQLLN